ncbi:MAG: L-lysine 6-transaminase [Candidatus Kapabacteria bacterium]|nr:L-lysine 6-transaminase [Candidatus Kapabacteria bacterium]MDW8012096.1 L-lysine 6-transaminase [Bacteroidota bacterium]
MFPVRPEEVLQELCQHILVDGFDLVVDLERSTPSSIVDARSGKEYLDLFTCFASMPLGFNHPKLFEPGFLRMLLLAALNKPSNSDLYTEIYATFVKTLFAIAAPPAFRYAFFIEGGALAVENALKVAFDWKVRRNFRKGYAFEHGHRILHFRQAFHGRSGYTLSLTNTNPIKTMYFPKFPWPRVHNPALRFPITDAELERVEREERQVIADILQAFHDYKDDIAAIIIEPIQGEGGDNHFRPEFLQALRQIADENEALLIFDEVQTGVGLTGTMWAHEQMGVTPDILVFGKKMQVCGILVTDRVDTEPENVFHVPGRINSTWGGNLVDMLRATRYLEIIYSERLLENAQRVGEYLQQRLQGLAQEFPELLSNVRGRGLFCAFDLPNPTVRQHFRRLAFEAGLLLLPCGERSIRFRPPLNITPDIVDEAIDRIASFLPQLRHSVMA